MVEEMINTTIKIINYTRIRFNQIFKFSIVGFINTIVSYVTYVFFVKLNFNYILANYIAFAFGVVNSYILNNKYVFKKNKFHIIPFFKTLLSYSTSSIIGTSLLIIMVELFGISEYIAPIFITAISVPFNYVVLKYWAFKTQDKS